MNRGSPLMLPLEAACESDRRWFAEHPGASRRLRKRIPGEFTPCEYAMVPSELTIVVQVAPGARVRSPAPLIGLGTS